MALSGMPKARLLGVPGMEITYAPKSEEPQQTCLKGKRVGGASTTGVYSKTISAIATLVTNTQQFLIRLC